jgi:hypothetical protein
MPIKDKIEHPKSKLSQETTSKLKRRTSKWISWWISTVKKRKWKLPTREM